MGNTVTSHWCFALCPIIPLFLSCRICLDDCNFHKDDPKCKGKSDLADNIVTTTMIQDFMVNLGQVQCPQDMCGHFNGTFNAPGTCTLDLSYVDSAGILRLIDGVHSASELCGVLKGKFDNDQCYINLKDTTAGGGGSEDDKKDACAKLKGTWDGTKCEVLGYTG